MLSGREAREVCGGVSGFKQSRPRTDHMTGDVFSG